MVGSHTTVCFKGVFGCSPEVECNGSVPSLGSIFMFGSSQEPEHNSSRERHIRCLCGTEGYLEIE